MKIMNQNWVSNSNIFFENPQLWPFPIAEGCWDVEARNRSVPQFQSCTTHVVAREAQVKSSPLQVDRSCFSFVRGAFHVFFWFHMFLCKWRNSQPGSHLFGVVVPYWPGWSVVFHRMQTTFLRSILPGVVSCSHLSVSSRQLGEPCWTGWLCVFQLWLWLLNHVGTGDLPTGPAMAVQWAQFTIRKAVEWKPISGSVWLWILGLHSSYSSYQPPGIRYRGAVSAVIAVMALIDHQGC